MTDAPPFSARTIIGKHKARFTEPPHKIPSNYHVDGPLLGNGDVGVVLAGPPEKLQFLFSKNDFWKSKPGYPDGGPRPIGGISLSAPWMRGATYQVATELLTAELHGTFSTSSATLNLHAWLAADSNIMIIELTAATGPVELGADLWVNTGDESTVSAHPGRAIAAVTRGFTGKDLEWPCTAAMALRGISHDLGSVTLNPGQTARYAVAIKSSFDSSSPRVEAENAVRELTAENINALFDSHRKWWLELWEESWVQLNDPLLERYYYGAQYILACCCRNREFPPGLWGNWITSDTPHWVGDYHLNYNHQAPFLGLYSSNHIGLTDCYDQPLLHYIGKGRKNAAELLGTRGIYYEVGLGPRGFCASKFRLQEAENALIGHREPEPLFCGCLIPAEETRTGFAHAATMDGGGQFWGQKSNALYGAIPMLLRWKYTGSLEYARQSHPYLIEVADFWEDYLRFESGRYVIYNDCLGEAGPFCGPDWEKLREDFNPVMSLAFLRFFFPALMEIEKALGIKPDRHPKWTHILEHLSDLPTQTDKDGMTLLGAEAGPSAARTGVSRPLIHGTIWPGTAVSPQRTPEYAARLRESMEQNWGEREWVHGGGHFDILPPAAARMGMDPHYILAMMRRRIELYGLPNLLIEQGGGGIETCGGMTGGVNEMLLQSYDGIIKLFPCWPPEHDAAFENLRAWGAFLVSSSISNSVVGVTRIQSEVGGDCVIANPWPGYRVAVSRGEGSQEIVTGENVCLSVEPNQFITMHRHSPSQSASPLRAVRPH